MNALGYINKEEKFYDYKTSIENLDDKNISYEEKDKAVESLKNSVLEAINSRSQEIGLLKDKLSKLNDAKTELTKQLYDLEIYKYDYSLVKSQMNLIKAINNEFKNKNIDSKAKMVFEYVVKLTDTKWQDAIESFLGIHRYAVLVEPQYFEIANEVFDKLKCKNVELVRTASLEKRDIQIVPDSVLNKLDVKNKIAYKYLAYWLGKIHAVANEEVAQHDNAISVDGKLSRNLSVTYMDFSKLKNYCLGFETYEINKNNLNKQIKNTDDEICKVEELIIETTHSNENLNNLLKEFKDFDYDAPKKLDDIKQLILEARKRRDAYIASLENNKEYLELVEREKTLSKKCDEARKKLDDLKHDKFANENKIKNNKLEIEKQTFNLNNENLAIKNYEEKDDIKIQNAINECLKYTFATIQNTIRAQSTRDNDICQLRKTEHSIGDLQGKYNSNKSPEEKLDSGLEFEEQYSKVYNRIKVDNLEALKAKQKDQTDKYRNIFENEFCGMVYQNCLEALENIADINKELRNLGFASKYMFQVKMKDGISDYAKIIKFAKHLNETSSANANQMSFGSKDNISNEEYTKLLKDIDDIIKAVSIGNEKNDDINKLADYRNYLDYEIKIDNDAFKDGKLSSQILYDSGAGAQIPFYIILSASLSMFYNARTNSVRLIFIDEPFEKMSDYNIKEMLKFFKQQNFQVILCAPENKLNSIGSECGTIVPVLKISSKLMKVGSVQFAK